MRLALVMVEEHAGRTVHLGNDHALGAVDDEGAVGGHERHVAHVHVLLLDILDRFSAGVLINFKHDEAQRHLQGGRIGHAALLAFLNVIFGGFEFVAHEFEHGLAGEVRDRENRLEHGLKPLGYPSALRFNHLQELIVGFLLDFDQVRHFGNFGGLTEELANALAAGECLGHLCSFVRSTY